MKSEITKKQLHIDGMTCSGCERKIEKRLKALGGVKSAAASYSNGTVSVSYDTAATGLEEILQVIETAGYVPRRQNLNPANQNTISQIAVIAIILLGFYMMLKRFGGLDFINYFPQAKEGTSYAMLLVIGLLTSVHCVAMCGGISLSQCAGAGTGSESGRAAPLRPSLLYNLGRIVSYTTLGGIVGGIGSVVSFSGTAKGIVALVAGGFMIIMGLNMLDLFPWLKKFNLAMPKFLTSGIDEQKKSNSPFYVGLLNGLMPCGPLQAMQLYALSTGSPAKGALSMLMFSLGTVPLMFGFGAVSTFLSRRFTAKIMNVSAVLVIILGFFMFSNGLSLSGVMLLPDNNATVAENSAGVDLVDGVQIVSIDVSPRGYAPITVKKGIPVKWIINAEAKNLNGCNYEIIVPAYNLSQKLEPGENIIEFTPAEAGTIPYSCWMGMIRSKIIVVD